VGLQLPARVRRAGALAVAFAALPLLSSCSEQSREDWERIAMPESASDRSDSILTLWQWTWVAAMTVGVLVWGLIIYSIIRFRRRRDDEVPLQARYNLPMEILYTVAPIIVVLVFFKFIIDTQADVDEEPEPDHTITVVGQKWSWTFNYVEEQAIGGETVHKVGTPADPPTLVLPVGETVQFNLRSVDVVHSFWVPAFTYKMDVIPGAGDNDRSVQSFTLTPDREGTFAGKCAEFCGTYHSRMLFNVDIVSPQEYEDYLRELSQNPENQGLNEGGDYARTQVGIENQEEGE
jgi:cytochrome c oxidase subunit 2